MPERWCQAETSVFRWRGMQQKMEGVTEQPLMVLGCLATFCGISHPRLAECLANLFGKPCVQAEVSCCWSSGNHASFLDVIVATCCMPASVLIKCRGLRSRYVPQHVSESWVQWGEGNRSMVTSLHNLIINSSPPAAVIFGRIFHSMKALWFLL